MDDLLAPRFEGRVGMARPLTGTTLTHMAALFDVLGEEGALAYLREIERRNREGLLNLVPGNGHVMRQVRDGKLAFGWTDTDDFNVALGEGAPVAAVYPDQGGIGTLLIPNTVAVLADAPHPDAARRFGDWLLAPGVEEELARSRAAQIPVRAGVPRPDHVIGAERLRFMEVDFQRLGAHLVERQALLLEMFLR
jgi:iron(III) transport system substrate-binding protein